MAMPAEHRARQGRVAHVLDSKRRHTVRGGPGVRLSFLQSRVDAPLPALSATSSAAADVSLASRLERDLGIA